MQCCCLEQPLATEAAADPPFTPVGREKGPRHSLATADFVQAFCVFSEGGLHTNSNKKLSEITGTVESRYNEVVSGH